MNSLAGGDLVAELVTARKKRGLSQAELAVRAGLPQSTIGRIEARLVSPNLETLNKILPVLGLRLHLFGDD
ncbi:MAG: helix-turn-helix transcriptional regulator [Bacilli bacterium]|nr:helix-turn-helix transcriptional regulator [Bacilli bacterium]